MKKTNARVDFKHAGSDNATWNPVQCYYRIMTHQVSGSCDQNYVQIVCFTVRLVMYISR